MKRTDITTGDGKITIHPAKLSALKARMRAALTEEDLEVLRNQVIDEEMEMLIQQTVVDEAAEAMRSEVRQQLTAGLAGALKV
jgi:hypothetical protein